jgi:spermidine synthase
LTKEGKHIIIDAFECDSPHLNDVKFLEEMCKKAALDANMEFYTLTSTNFSHKV